jgi:murein DD-endopeptidase MepM/ murein hydrolase activator NlpD
VLFSLGFRMRARCLCIALLVASTAVLAGPATVARAASSGGNDQKAKVQKDLEDVTAAQTAAAAQLKAAQAQKAAIDAKVNALDVQVNSAQAQLAPLAAAAAQLGAEYTSLQQQVQAKQAELAVARKALDRSAVQMYQDARQGTAYDILTVSRPIDLVVGNKYLDHISNERTRTVQKVTELRDELDAQQKAVADQKAKADAAAAAAQAEANRVASLRAQVEPARTQAAAAESDEFQAVSALGQQKQQLEAQLNALKVSSDSISGVLRSHGGTPGRIGGCVVRPVQGGITSPFGPRLHPILGRVIVHTGDDLAAGMGTPIHACRAGTVVIASPQGGYGNATVIDDGGGMGTLYGHQSRFGVTVGQHVDAGQVIGYVGMTGLATGPHLHFEVRINGNPVDPTSYL